MTLQQAPARVVFVVNSLVVRNGVLSATRVLADSFSRRGSAVSFINGSETSPDLAHYSVFHARPFARFTADMDDFATSRAELKPIRRLASVFWRPIMRWRLAPHCGRFGPETLMIGAGLETFEIVLRNGTARCVAVGQVHMSAAGLTDAELDLVRRCSISSSATTALSADDASMLGAEGVSRCVRMPNPLPLERDERREPSKVVLYMGRLSPEKQVDHIIKAFAESAPPEWTLRICGDGPSRDDLEQVAASLEAEVEFAGQVDDVASEFAAAQLHVMTSRREGQPMSILEASSCGVATLAYDCAPGVREALADHGILVPPQDLSTFTAELGRLLGAPVELRERGEAAQRDSVRYSPDVVLDSWSHLWATSPSLADLRQDHSSQA